MYWIQKMCFLCLTTNKSLTIYKADSNDTNNDKLKILLDCYPKLTTTKLDVPIYMCSSCEHKLTLYYDFKLIGEANYNCYLSYLNTLKEANKHEGQKFMDVNVVIDCESDIIAATTNYHSDMFYDCVKHEKIEIDHDNINNSPIHEALIFNKDEVNINYDFFSENINKEFTEKVSQDDTDREVIYEIKIPFHDVEDLNTNVDNFNEKLNIQTEHETVTETFNKPELNIISELDISNTDETEANSNDIVQVEHQEDAANDELSYQTDNHCNDKNFNCSLCSKKFRYKRTLHRHIKLHSSKKSFCCTFCSVDKPDKRIVSKDDNLMTCDNRKLNYLKHFKYKTVTQKHNKRISCSICLKNLSSKSALNKHHINIHNGKKSFFCSICSVSYIYKGALKKHELLHGEQQNHNAIITKLMNETIRNGLF